jgi:hypothetical protein
MQSLDYYTHRCKVRAGQKNGTLGDKITTIFNKARNSNQSHKVLNASGTVFEKICHSFVGLIHNSLL